MRAARPNPSAWRARPGQSRHPQHILWTRSHPNMVEGWGLGPGAHSTEGTKAQGEAAAKTSSLDSWYLSDRGQWANTC